MTILDRNRIPTYLTPSSGGSSSIALSEAKRGDPSSNYFQYPPHLLPLDAKKLIQWMRECHYAANLQLVGSDARHLRQASRLVNKHGHDDLIRAVKLASQVATHSFTFTFVERILTG